VATVVSVGAAEIVEDVVSVGIVEAPAPSDEDARAAPAGRARIERAPRRRGARV
jgi:hypothetical protein